MFRLFSLAVAFLLMATGVHAREERPFAPASGHGAGQQRTTAPDVVRVSPPASREKPMPGQAYRVTLTCAKDAAAEQRIASIWNRLPNLLVSNNSSMSLFVTFHTGDQKFDDLKPLPPDGILFAIPVMVSDSQNHLLVDAFESCNRSFLLASNNNKPIWVNPVYKASESRKAGAVFDILQAVSNAAGPLTALMGGPPGAEALTAFNDNAQKLKDPLTSFVGLFDGGDWRPVPFRLFVTRRTISVPDVGKVVVDVTPIDSIIALRTKDPDMLRDLNAVLDSLTSKPQPGEGLAATCVTIVKDLNKAGITSDADIAYALLRLSGSLPAKADVLECLGEDKFKHAAAALPQALKGTSSSTNITEDDVARVVSQPDYRLLARSLASLVAYLPKYPVSKDRLMANFAGQLVVENASSETRLEPLASPAADAELTINQLAGLGFRRFGCSAKTTAATGAGDDGAAAQFLMFDAAPGETKVCLSRTIMIRPFFTGDYKLNKLVFSGNEDWIRALLQARSPAGSCGDGRITVDLGC